MSMIGRMRQWLGSWWNAPGRYSRSGMAGVLVLAVVFVALGTGYATTKAVVGDDSAWLQKGDTVVQVNGPSRRYDAVVADHPMALAASDKDQLQVNEDPTGQVYVANAASHDVYKINLNTMEPQSIATPGTGVLAAANAHYVVDASSGVVRKFNPQTLALSAPVKVPGGIASSAIAPDGTAYVGSDTGSVTEVTAGHPQTVSVTAKTQQVGVSVVGTQPVAVDDGDGQLHLLSNTGVTSGPVISLPGVANSTVEVAPALSTGNLWLIRGTQLEQVNLVTTQTSVVSLPNDDEYGARRHVRLGARLQRPDGSHQDRADPRWKPRDEHRRAGGPGRLRLGRRPVLDRGHGLRHRRLHRDGAERHR
jgi:hypothetical protein